MQKQSPARYFMASALAGRGGKDKKIDRTHHPAMVYGIFHTILKKRPADTKGTESCHLSGSDFISL